MTDFAAVKSQSPNGIVLLDSYQLNCQPKSYPLSTRVQEIVKLSFTAVFNALPELLKNALKEKREWKNTPMARYQMMIVIGHFLALIDLTKSSYYIDYYNDQLTGPTFLPSPSTPNKTQYVD